MTERHSSGWHGADVVQSVWRGVSVIGTGEGFVRQSEIRPRSVCQCLTPLQG